MKYKHDCDRCKPLGEYRHADLYFCYSCGEPTVIARLSDDGPDYDSGLYFAETNDLLREAKQRAIKAGYLKYEPS